MAAVLNLMVMAYASVKPKLEAGSLAEIRDETTFVSMSGQVAGQDQITNLSILNGRIYSGTGDGGMLLRAGVSARIPPSMVAFNGTDAFVDRIDFVNSQDKMYDLHTLGGVMYGSAGTSGVLYQSDETAVSVPSLASFDGISAFTTEATELNKQNQILSLSVLGSDLYGAAATSGCLFKLT
jgi:hypothetical protein